MKERINLLHREAQRHRADNCGMHDVDPFVVVAAIDQRRDLLAVAKKLLDRLEREGSGAKENWYAIDAARDVIARAEAP